MFDCVPVPWVRPEIKMCTVVAAQKKLGVRRRDRGAKAKEVLGLDEEEVMRAKRCTATQEEQRAYANKNGKKVAKIFGISNHEVLDAVRDSSRSSSSSKSRSDGEPPATARGHGLAGAFVDEPTRWTTWIDRFVVLVLLGALCYALQVSTEGTFGRVLAGILPREMEALGLKNYLERTH